METDFCCETPTGKCEGLRRRGGHLRLTLPRLLLTDDIMAATQLDALMAAPRTAAATLLSGDGCHGS